MNVHHLALLQPLPIAADCAKAVIRLGQPERKTKRQPRAHLQNPTGKNCDFRFATSAANIAQSERDQRRALH
jgi:hypothetical protein